jgi:Ca2+/Na+ antiporter
LIGLILSASIFVAYLGVLAIHRNRLQRLPVPKRFSTWLSSAIEEEETELNTAIRPRRGRPIDTWLALAALVVVVLASIAMEHGATSLGHHFHIADAIVGGIVLAAVTSLPNAVAAVHLAASGRGAAALSTALTSNNLNVIAGLLIPGAIVGLAHPSFAGNFTALAYLALTALVLAIAFVKFGLSRRAGGTIIVGYAVFVLWLTVISVR